MVRPGPMERVVVGKRGVDRIRGGHPWIYRSDLSPDPREGIESGAAVEVVDGKGRLLGSAFYSVRSQIALRFYAREKVDADEALLRQRLQSAVAMRERLFPGSRFGRLVHGEADFLPGLVIDRYGDHLSVQTLTPAMESRKEIVCDLLEELLQPAGIVERNDVRTRELEGLEQRKGVLRGSYEAPTIYEEGEARMQVDLVEGQKTGAFLDQRENHLHAGGYARGRALDLFSYVGGFALQLARHLHGREGLTVVTNNLAVYEELVADETIDILLLGGLVRRNYRSLVGFLTEDSLRGIRADLCFLGISGIAEDGSLLDSTVEEIPAKRAMVAASKHVVLLADGAKFWGSGLGRVAGIDIVHTLVTTDDAPEERLDALVEAGIDVRIAT